LNARQAPRQGASLRRPAGKPGLPHAALKASLDGESARPLARVVGVVSQGGWTRLSADGEGFAGFANGCSGGINAV